MSSGRVALVTGGSRGLGRVMALAMIGEGHDVVLAGTAEAALQAVAAEAQGMAGRAACVRCDLSRPGEAERLAAEAVRIFGRIDVLCNNAGTSLGTIRADYMARPYRFLENNRAVIETFFQLHAISPMLLSTLLAPAMVERGWGRIVANTTSLDSMLRFSLYGGSKAALEAETAVQASDLAGTGVTANVLIPGGGTGSGMTDAAGIARDILFPDTIMAAPMTFLASDASDGFTGRRLLANRWDPALAPPEAAAKASDPIAWTGYGSPGVHPATARSAAGPATKPS